MVTQLNPKFGALRATIIPPVVVRDDALPSSVGAYSCWQVELARFFAINGEVPSWL